MSNGPIELSALEGERGVPSVNEHGTSRVQRGVVFVFIVLVVIVAAGLIYWKAAQQAKLAADKDQKVLRSSTPTRTFIDPPQLTPTPETTAPAPAPAAAPPRPGVDLNQHSAPALDKSGSGMMAGNSAGGLFGSNSAPASPTPLAPGRARAPGGVSGGIGGGAGGFDGAGNSPLGGVSSSNLAGTGGGGGSLGGMLSSTSTPKRLAGHLGNRNFILAKGSFIDCALQTKLDSTVPGMTACVVTRNIYSDNGKVLLVERGSTISGEYQSNMRQGMARIFVLWSRIKTPNGIIINLDSPGTDPLGGSGLPGYIDNHFWERFGGALMLSLVNDVAAYATQRGSGNTNINLNSTSEATQNMAAEALKATINIPPTLYKNQGEQVGVYVARDLDFSSVYDVSPAEE